MSIELTQVTRAPNRRVSDILNREVEGFDGTPIYVETHYDVRGRREKISRPFYAGQTKYFTTYTYDLLGRALTENSFVTGLTTHSYSGFVTTLTNAKGQVTKETRNVMDWTLATTDANNKTVNYGGFNFQAHQPIE